MHCLFCNKEHEFFNDGGTLKYKDTDCVFIRPPRRGEYWRTKRQTVEKGEELFCGTHNGPIPEGVNYWALGHRGHDYGLILDDRICEPCQIKINRREKNPDIFEECLDNSHESCKVSVPNLYETGLVTCTCPCHREDEA